ncbi:MAG: acyl carrier protein [Ignavibacteria bacterium CG_4_10_14_3_um_filter_37_18]|nr:MAG: acyl carrier protein [Ignavibacteria bacterium CG_4_10_14_3_um_filter_37_18]
MRDEIIAILLKVCNELNEQLKNKIETEKGEQAPLFGKQGVLDSLGLVNLIVSAESEVEDKFGKSLMLTDGTSLPEANSPFRTIGSLAYYITDLLEDEKQ